MRVTGSNGRTDTDGVPMECSVCLGLISLLLFHPFPLSDHLCAQRYDVQTHHSSYEPRSSYFSATPKCLEKQALLPTFHHPHKAVDIFNYQTLHEALQTLDEPPQGEYESEKGTPLPAYGSIAHHYQQQEFIPPLANTNMESPSPHSRFRHRRPSRMTPRHTILCNQRIHPPQHMGA
jgi:hypothetical protein